MTNISTRLYPTAEKTINSEGGVDFQTFSPARGEKHWGVNLPYWAYSPRDAITKITHIDIAVHFDD